MREVKLAQIREQAAKVSTQRRISVQEARRGRLRLEEGSFRPGQARRRRRFVLGRLLLQSGSFWRLELDATSQVSGRAQQVLGSASGRREI